MNLSGRAVKGRAPAAQEEQGALARTRFSLSALFISPSSLCFLSHLFFYCVCSDWPAAGV